MSFRGAARKVAKFVLSSSPETHVSVNVANVVVGSTLEGRRIVVTGGSRGLGYAMAERFLREGAAVVISGRNKVALQEAAAKLGPNVSTVVFDVSEIENAPAFLNACERSLGGTVDCLVSNAGVSLHEGRFTNVTVDGFDLQFDTNMRGMYFLCKEFLERKEAERGHNPAQLLVITSEAADQCCDIPYGMTKAATNSFIRAASRRAYKKGIRVNGIAPGVTLTEMTRDYAGSLDGNLYRDCASGRVFLPEEVAEVACFLLSDASACISGEIIHTNAGNHLSVWWDE